MEEFLELLLDSFLDSLKVFGFCVLIYILLSFIEDKMTKFLVKHKHLAPFSASLFGLVPQCGFSVVASDLYIKNHITIGALFAAFFACSDEALPILISSGSKAIYLIPLLLTKLILGFSFGYIIDLIFKRKVNEDISDDFSHDHIGCCHHHIEDESKIKSHLIHPLLHSLKIFLYVFLISLAFGGLVLLIGEENIKAFLSSSKWFTPIIATIIGLIPNCASSAILTEAFIEEVLPFGALVSGLCVNAGLGILYLLKNKDKRKNALYLLLGLFLTSIIVGYLVMLINLLF